MLINLIISHQALDLILITPNEPIWWGCGFSVIFFQIAHAHGVLLQWLSKHAKHPCKKTCQDLVVCLVCWIFLIILTFKGTTFRRLQSIHDRNCIFYLENSHWFIHPMYEITAISCHLKISWLVMLLNLNCFSKLYITVLNNIFNR